MLLPGERTEHPLIDVAAALPRGGEQANVSIHAECSESPLHTRSCYVQGAAFSGRIGRPSNTAFLQNSERVRSLSCRCIWIDLVSLNRKLNAFNDLLDCNTPPWNSAEKSMEASGTGWCTLGLSHQKGVTSEVTSIPMEPWYKVHEALSNETPLFHSSSSRYYRT